MNSFVYFLSFCLVVGIRIKKKALPLADKRTEKKDVYWPLLGTIVSQLTAANTTRYFNVSRKCVESSTTYNTYL